jgi:hypothetical protein
MISAFIMISWGQNAPIKMPCKVPSFCFVNRPEKQEVSTQLIKPSAPAAPSRTHWSNLQGQLGGGTGRLSGKSLNGIKP